MPHLVQMDKKLRKKGLVIIGAESQGSSDKEIKKVTDEANVEFTITKGADGPVLVRGLPAALIFDASGKLIFKGKASDNNFATTIKKALKEVGLNDRKRTNVSLIAQRKWTNTDGKKITASVKSVDGEEVTFKLHNSKIVKYKLTNLSEPDQKIIKAALAAAAKKDSE